MTKQDTRPTVKDYLPSHNRPKRPFILPEGAQVAWLVSGIDVTKFRGQRFEKIGLFFDEDLAYKIADERHRSREFKAVTVTRKAVIRLNGKVYMLYYLPARIDDDVYQPNQNQEPENAGS